MLQKCQRLNEDLRISDSKSLQLSRTLLRILTDFNGAKVLILPVISNSPSIFPIPSECSECTNYNWYHRHLQVQQFFSSHVRSRNLSSFSHSFIFTLGSARKTKSTIWWVLFFLVIDTGFGHTFLCQTTKECYISFSWTEPDLRIYHFSAQKKLYHLHNSLLINSPTQSCIFLYCFFFFVQFSAFAYYVINRFTVYYQFFFFRWHK